VRIRDNNPKRVKLLGTVNPLSADAGKEMERQWSELNVDGFKFYPTFYQEGKARQLDLDDELMPLVKKASDLGVEHIGVHKVFPVGPVGVHRSGVEDVAEIAAMYPDIDFEILHLDKIYLEETKFMLGNYDNVWVNLEFTTGFMMLQPGRFAEILGELLVWGDPERIIFSAGIPLAHPQSYIEEFCDFQFPAEMREKHGYPKLTDDLKRMILGENLIELYGWDADDLRSTVESDKWATIRDDQGQPEPWSSLS
jgi:predicted TIM-barrel fold metal-dependent hydrolase